MIALASLVSIAAIAVGVMLYARSGGGSSGGGGAAGGGAAGAADASSVVYVGRASSAIDAGPAIRSATVSALSESLDLWAWDLIVRKYNALPAGSADRVAAESIYEQALQRLIEEKRTELQVLFARGECEASRTLADRSRDIPELAEEMNNTLFACLSFGHDKPLKQVPYVVYFPQSGTSLESRHSEWLERVVEILQRRSGDVMIYGFGDASEGAAIVDGLASARAKSVRTYLIDKGISARRLTAQGRGEGLFVDGAWRNRRVSLVPVL